MNLYPRLVGSPSALPRPLLSLRCSTLGSSTQTGGPFNQLLTNKNIHIYWLNLNFDNKQGIIALDQQKYILNFRVLKDFKGKAAVHVEWVKAWGQCLAELQVHDGGGDGGMVMVVMMVMVVINTD